jgi:hypothetical protein
VLYRNCTNGRLTFAITNTLPSNLVTGTITPVAVYVSTLYAQNLNCNNLTANRLFKASSAGAPFESLPMPFTSSYGQSYIINTTDITYAAGNTYYTFGNRWQLGNVTSGWAATTNPGIGLIYSGADAMMEIECSVSYYDVSNQTKYTTVAFGAGTPVPGYAVTTKNSYTTISSNTNAWANGWVRFVARINTNDSIIPYTASSGITTARILSGNLTARVLSYV